MRVPGSGSQAEAGGADGGRRAWLVAMVVLLPLVAGEVAARGEGFRERVTMTLLGGGVPRAAHEAAPWDGAAASGALRADHAVGGSPSRVAEVRGRLLPFSLYALPPPAGSVSA